MTTLRSTADDFIRRVREELLRSPDRHPNILMFCSTPGALMANRNWREYVERELSEPGLTFEWSGPCYYSRSWALLIRDNRPQAIEKLALNDAIDIAPKESPTRTRWFDQHIDGIFWTTLFVLCVLGVGLFGYAFYRHLVSVLSS